MLIERARQLRALVPSDETPLALLIIHDPDHELKPRPRILKELYGLTAAEADLAERLASGARLDEIAQKRCVSLPTLRTQLSSVLKKNGSDRQATLIRLLTRLSVTG